MHKNDDDYYDRQTELLEKFLSQNDRSAFQKILNMNILSNSDKEKERVKFRNKSLLLKSLKTKPSPNYYEHFHMYNGHNYYNNNNGNNNSELFNFNYNNNYKDNQISSFKLDFHNILQDPDYKDKCMKGNYKWGSMKFQMMKLNLAKRKGIPLDNFEMPKIADRRKNQMEMNGHLVINNNPLANSVDIKRKNTVSGTSIGHNYRNSLKKLSSNDVIIRRQATQKLKPNILKTEVKELNIEI